MTSMQPTRTTRQLQVVIIAFFVCITISLVVIYLVEPTIYTTAAGLSAPLLLVPLLLFEALLVIGTLRRWRWVFWLILVAFGLSGLRVPVMALQLAGIVPLEPPLWYSLVRTLIAAVQVIIALWMIRLYRRHGIWAQRERAAPEESA